MKKIVLSHNIPKEYYEEYVTDMQVAVPKEPLTAWTKEEAKEVIKDADIFICYHDFKMDQELIDSAENLEIVGNVGSGYDNVDWRYAKEKGIHVLNAPRSVMEATSEMTVALMMSVCRGVVQYDRELKRDLVMKRQLFFYRDMVLYGKTLGVIGMGRIGHMVARQGSWPWNEDYLLQSGCNSEGSRGRTGRSTVHDRRGSTEKRRCGNYPHSIDGRNETFHQC